MLAIIAAMAFAGIHLYSVARSQARVTEAITKINHLVSVSYRWLAATKGNFCGRPEDVCLHGINNIVLINAGLATASDFVSPWPPMTSESIRVYADVAEPNELQLSLENIPPKACHALLAKIQQKARMARCDDASRVLQATF